MGTHGWMWKLWQARAENKITLNAVQNVPYLGFGGMWTSGSGGGGGRAPGLCFQRELAFSCAQKKLIVGQVQWMLVAMIVGGTSVIRRTMKTGLQMTSVQTS